MGSIDFCNQGWKLTTLLICEQWGAAYRVSGKDEEQLVLSVSISKPDIEQVRFSTCGTSTLSLPYKAMCPLPSL
jgi:hypothetical protein